MCLLSTKYFELIYFLHKVKISQATEAWLSNKCIENIYTNVVTKTVAAKPRFKGFKTILDSTEKAYLIRSPILQIFNFSALIDVLRSKEHSYCKSFK